MKKAIFSIMLLGGMLLTGCGGGGGDSSSNSNLDPSTVTITAIDGYLGSAEVFSDKNLNWIADSDEYLGDTAEDGQISVPIAALDYPIIVKVVAGKTTDSDVAGKLTANKQLIAANGVKYVTPFTTLAALQQIDLTQLAEELGLEIDEISGDFISGNHKEAHVIARSVMALFEAELVNTALDIAALMQKANSFSSYVALNPKDDWSDEILVISDNGVVSESGEENVLTQFNYSKASFIWETKDFSEYTYGDGEVFHPCYVRLLNEEVIVVGNCFGNYFLTLSVADGSILNSLDLSEGDVWSNGKEWFAHGDIIHVTNGGASLFYDNELKPLTSEQVNLSVKTAISPNGYEYLDYTDDGAMTALVDKANNYTQTVKNTWLADDVTYRVYDSETGVLSEIGSDGIVKETPLATQTEIVAAVMAVHNSSEFGEESPMLEEHFTGEAYSGSEVTYLTDKTFLVRHDSNQAKPGYVTNDYHFFYIEGKVVYLGQFNQTDWYKGLDNSTVTAYSSIRMGINNTDPHIFRQYRISDGELIGNHEVSYDQMNGVLYGQVHTAQGIISISDSYSSVSLFQ